jgi:hypothetical protein
MKDGDCHITLAMGRSAAMSAIALTLGSLRAQGRR